MAAGNAKLPAGRPDKREIMMRTGMFKTFVSGVIGLGMVLLPDAARAQTPSYEQIVQGAKREGALILNVTSPSQDASRKRLVEAFNKRFGLDTKVQFISMHCAAANARIIAEAQAGKASFDMVGCTIDVLVPLLDKNLLRTFSW